MIDDSKQGAGENGEGRFDYDPEQSEDAASELEDEFDVEGDEDDLDEVDTSVSIDVTGLSVYTHHGASAAERDVGQRLLIDISFELGACDATISDELVHTVDYGAVCEQVWLVAQERSYKTLERLGSVICDRLMDQFGADSVTVRCTKPQPPIPLPVGEVSVEVWKER